MSKIEGPSGPKGVGDIGPKEEGGPTGDIAKEKLPQEHKNPLLEYFNIQANAQLRQAQEKGALTPQSVMEMAKAMDLSEQYKEKFKSVMKDTPSDQPLDSKTYKDVTKVLGEATYDRLIIQGLGKDMLISLQHQESARKAREAERKQIEGQ